MPEDKVEVNFEFLKKLATMWQSNATRLAGAASKGSDISLGIAEMSVYAPVQDAYMESVTYILKLFRDSSLQSLAMSTHATGAHDKYKSIEEGNSSSLHLDPDIALNKLGN